MLFYDKITESEGLDTTESTNVICTGAGSSKQCDLCHFYFCFFVFFGFRPKTPFWGNFSSKKSKLSVEAEIWYLD